MNSGPLRDQIEDLDACLMGVGARAIPLQELASAVRDGQVPPALPDLLETVDRNLTRASRALAMLRDRIDHETESLRAAPHLRDPGRG